MEVDGERGPAAAATCAVTTAWSSWDASEHHGLEPCSWKQPSAGLASSRRPAASAAKTPQARRSGRRRSRAVPAFQLGLPGELAEDGGGVQLRLMARPAATSTAVTEARISTAARSGPRRVSVRPLLRPWRAPAGRGRRRRRSAPSRRGPSLSRSSGAELIRTAASAGNRESGSFGLFSFKVRLVLPVSVPAGRRLLLGGSGRR